MNAPHGSLLLSGARNMCVCHHGHVCDYGDAGLKGHVSTESLLVNKRYRNYFMGSQTEAH